MILGWMLLAVAIALAASLTYSATRILIEEHRQRLRRRPVRSRARTDRIRRVGRVMIEPIVGR